jgi:hypothetical protein
LRKAFNRIVEEGGDFEVLDMHVGKSNADPSRATLAVKASDPAAVDRILEGLSRIDEPVDPLARRELAARGVAFHRLLAAAERDLR